jgi:Kef-type K+ transport system membrane component KefB
VIVGFVVISFASWKIGTVIIAFKLPIITGYLLTGILAGPFVMNTIPTAYIRRLDFIGIYRLPFSSAISHLFVNEEKYTSPDYISMRAN